MEFHYRYYQFGANALVALVFTYVAYRSSLAEWFTHWGTKDVVFIVVCVVLFLGSRDALARYYRRAGELLSAK